jgi:hypothetical protein
MPALTRDGKHVQKMAYYDVKLWKRLGKRLVDERKTYTAWAREAAEAYLANGKHG